MSIFATSIIQLILSIW